MAAQQPRETWTYRPAPPPPLPSSSSPHPHPPTTSTASETTTPSAVLQSDMGAVDKPLPAPPSSSSSTAPPHTPRSGTPSRPDPPPEVPDRSTSLRSDRAGLEDGLQRLGIRDDADTATAASSSASATTLAAIDQQRSELGERLAAEARERYRPLSAEGRGVFEGAGMGDKVDVRGEVEVRTEWLRPVVQETIIVKEHVEVTEIVDREIHKHHIFPKIQPIEDPDPILLERCHRIYNPWRGTWHEVLGDAAAIELLGEHVFLHGPREERMVRAPALPALPGVRLPAPGLDDETRATATDSGGATSNEFRARTIEREGTGGKMGSWRDVLGGDVHGGSPPAGDESGRMIGEVDVHAGERSMRIAI